MQQNDLRNDEPIKPAWIAVFSLAIGVFGLLTAEYLPASLLTPMASDLGVSIALVGQTVTVTAVVALIAGLSVPRLTRRFDRRTVLLTFTILMIASNLLVALSSNLIVLLTMRILLGFALGGFWSMAAAVTMRLVPAKFVPRALSIIFSGIAIGTVVSIPLGSYLGGLYGWRSAFFAATAVGVITLIFQLLTLPSMKPMNTIKAASVLEVLRRPGIMIAMIGCLLAHTGQYALFTYIRPAIESIVVIGVDELSLMLLVFGVANFIGTLFAGWLMEKSLRATLILMPVLVSIAAFGMVFLPMQESGLIALLALWGVAFGGIPVAWSNWVALAIPDQAETAGGMVVATVQSSIAIGAALGGIVFGMSSVHGVFIISGGVMLFAALVIILGVRIKFS